MQEKTDGLNQAQAEEEVAKLPDQQQNFISDLTGWSERQRALRREGQDLVARWNLNGTLAKLIDAQIKAIPSFAHLDAAKITDAVTTLQGSNDYFGDDISGPITNLIKLKG